jgi:hypothetical protein
MNNLIGQGTYRLFAGSRHPLRSPSQPPTPNNRRHLGPPQNPVSRYTEGSVCYVNICNQTTREINRDNIEIRQFPPLGTNPQIVDVKQSTELRINISPGGNAKIDLGGYRQINLIFNDTLRVQFSLELIESLTGGTITMLSSTRAELVTQSKESIVSAVCGNQNMGYLPIKELVILEPIVVENGIPCLLFEIPVRPNEESSLYFSFVDAYEQWNSNRIPADRLVLTGNRTTVSTAVDKSPKVCAQRSCEFLEQGVIIPNDRGNIYHIDITQNRELQNQLVVNLYNMVVPPINGTCRLGELISRHELSTNQQGVMVGLSEYLSPNFEVNTNGTIIINDKPFEYHDFKSIKASQIQVNAQYIVRLVENNGHTELRIAKNPPQLDRKGFIKEQVVDLGNDFNINEDYSYIHRLFTNQQISYVLIENQKDRMFILTVDHNAMASTITTLTGEYFGVDSTDERAIIVYKQGGVVIKQWLDSAGVRDVAPIPSIDIKNVWNSQLHPCLETNDIRFLKQTIDNKFELVSCDLDTGQVMSLWKSELTDKSITDIQFKDGDSYIITKSVDGIYKLTIVLETYWGNDGDKKTHGAYVWSFNLNNTLNLNQRLAQSPQLSISQIMMTGIGKNGLVILSVEIFDEVTTSYSRLTYALNIRTVNPSEIVSHQFGNVTVSTDQKPISFIFPGGTKLPEQQPEVMLTNVTTTPSPEIKDDHLPKSQDETKYTSIIGSIVGASVGGVIGAALILVSIKYRKKINDAASNAFQRLRNYTQHQSEGIQMEPINDGIMRGPNLT